MQKMHKLKRKSFNTITYIIFVKQGGTMGSCRGCNILKQYCRQWNGEFVTHVNEQKKYKKIVLQSVAKSLAHT